LLIEELRHGIRINAGHGNKRADAVHDQGHQHEQQAFAQFGDSA
jgi:hypothetical protein